MRKLLATTICLSVAASAMAAENTVTTKMGEIYDSLVASPLSLNITNEMNSSRDKKDENKVNGHDSYIYTNLSYKLTDSDKVTLNPNFNYSNTDKVDDSQFKMTDITLKYARSGILSEDKHGIYANAQMQYIIGTDGAGRNAGANNGYAQGRLYVGRTLTEALSLDGQFRAYQYIKRNGADDVRANRFRAYAAPTLSITDKLTATVLGMYEININTNDNTAQKILIEPGLSYSFNNNISADLYVDLTPYTTNDVSNSLTMNKGFRDDVTYGMVVSMTAF